MLIGTALAQMFPWSRPLKKEKITTSSNVTNASTKLLIPKTQESTSLTSHRLQLIQVAKPIILKEAIKLIASHVRKTREYLKPLISSLMILNMKRMKKLKWVMVASNLTKLKSPSSITQSVLWVSLNHLNRRSIKITWTSLWETKVLPTHLFNRKGRELSVHPREYQFEPWTFVLSVKVGMVCFCKVVRRGRTVPNREPMLFAFWISSTPLNIKQKKPTHFVTKYYWKRRININLKLLSNLRERNCKPACAKMQ